MNNKYYIYFHINPVKNEIFYVGKGSGKRAWSKKGRSQYWNRIRNKYGWIVNIIEEGLNNQQAMEREKFYIKKIGRNDLGLGTLVNHTDGGEGCVNMSQNTKNKISVANEGKHNSTNTEFKEGSIIGIKTRYKKGQEALNKRKILQFNNNFILIKEWKSIKEAAITLKLERPNIIKVCKGERKHTGGFIFKYKTNE